LTIGAKGSPGCGIVGAIAIAAISLPCLNIPWNVRSALNLRSADHPLNASQYPLGATSADMQGLSGLNIL